MKIDNVCVQAECDVFLDAVRAQLTTTSSKPCSYFATYAESGERVFVKGPYCSRELASKQIWVHAFKKMLCPELPSIECSVVELVVSPGFLDCQFGARNSRKWDIPGFFLVCEDVLCNTPRVLPTKLAHSKVWGRPVPVVDFEHASIASQIKHVWYSKEDSLSIFVLHPDLAFQYVLHVLFSWVCGCGADLARRNFLVTHAEPASMFQVDLEAWGRFGWEISDTIPGSSRTQAGRQLREFFLSSARKFKPILEKACANMEENGESFFEERCLSVSDFHAITHRLGEIQHTEGVIRILDRKTTPKPKKLKKKQSVL